MKRECSAIGCERPHKGHGWCNTHNERLRKTGSVKLKTIRERFWEKVDKSTDCWLWTAATTRNGYGHLAIGKKKYYAHRVAYHWAKGAIPPGLDIDHICRTRSCVNPDHLRAVTRAENVRNSTKTTAVRTHCPQGHPYIEGNIYWTKHAETISGYSRRCRACEIARQKRLRDEGYYDKQSA